ncbi:thioesterase family protein [Chloroflexota bacterium]
MSDLAVGLTGQTAWTVEDSMTAAKIGSGLVAVFATPTLAALLESAAVAALEGQLEEGYTSVGTHIDVYHLAATPVGMTVRATATLTAVDGRKLTFDIAAWDEVEQIGKAVHERIIVEQNRFAAKTAQKQLGSR